MKDKFNRLVELLIWLMLMATCVAAVLVAFGCSTAATSDKLTTANCRSETKQGPTVIDVTRARAVTISPDGSVSVIADPGAEK